MKIAHFADTHIRNLWYHEEYDEVFRKIDEYLTKNPVDVIVHAGDVLHNKNVLSPESVLMTANFLRVLTDHAPTFVVPGNHDGVICNVDRKDSVSAISTTIGVGTKHPLVVLKDTGKYDIGGSVFLCPVSIFDPEIRWDAFPDRQRGDGIWIGIYHGTIGSVVTETNYTLVGDETLDKFDKFDYLMLGHIHKEQKIDRAGKARYPGSTIQQGYEEGTNKGFLVWDIKGKDDFSVEKVLFQNPVPFQSFVVDSVDEFRANCTKKGILQNARLKFTICDVQATPADVSKLEKTIRTKFSPVTFQVAKGSTVATDTVNTAIRSMTLGSVEVQNSLIRDYLYDTMCIRDPEVIESVVAINSELFSQEDPELFEVMRDCDWKVRKLAWSNFFNYSSDNAIDFGNIRQGSVVGVFGRNASGKSSLIDILCYGIWGKVTKENSKNGELIRMTEKSASVSIDIEQFGEVSEIFRALDRQKNGSTTSELLFRSGKEEEDVKQNNAEDRKANTTRSIASHFGSFADFCSTSFMSQDGGLMFISEGSAARRDLLKKVLNLNVFDKRIKRVNEEISFFKRKKKLENREQLEKEVSELSEKIEDLEREYLLKRDEYRAIADKEKEVSLWLSEFEKKNYEVLQLGKRKFRDNLETSIAGLVSEYLVLRRELCGMRLSAPISTEKETLDDLEKQLFNAGLLVHGQWEAQVAELEREIARKESRLKSLRAKEEIKTPPCVDDGFVLSRPCEFVEDYKRRTEEKKQEISEIEAFLRDAPAQLNQLLESFNKDLKIEQLLTIRVMAAKRFAKKEQEYQVMCQRYSAMMQKIKQIGRDFVALRRELRERRSVEEKKASLVGLFAEKASKDAALEQILKDKRVCEADGKGIRDRLAGEKARLEVILEKEKELANDVAQEYRLELLQKAIGGNGGVVVALLKHYVPLINAEANRVVGEVFDDMVVRLEATEKDTLEVYYSRGGREECNVGMASGSEKAAISLALRLALSSVSSLPKSNIFIMDEPFASFDFSRIDDFEKILSLLRSKFEYVVLITHSEKVKDLADEIIHLSPDENGVTSVNV